MDELDKVIADLEAKRREKVASSTWLPVDLAAVADGRISESAPSILERTDEVAILYPGKKHLLAGEPESAKGWIAMLAAAGELLLGRRVLYLDFENAPATALERLGALGVPLETILELFIYVRPDGQLDRDPTEIALGATLAVIDGMTDAMHMLGFNPYDNSEVAGFFAKLARPLADTGAAELMLDHVVKDRDARGRWAIGAQHKIAGSDVCFSLEAIRPFGRGLTGGLSRLTLTKDRPGFLRQHAVGRSRLGDVHLDSDGELVSIRIEPPEDTTETGFRPTALMERVSRYLELYPSGQTQNAALRDVRGRSEYVRQAFQALVAEGYVSRDDGPRGSFICRSIKPYRENP